MLYFKIEIELKKLYKTVFGNMLNLLENDILRHHGTYKKVERIETADPILVIYNNATIISCKQKQQQGSFILL